MGAFRFRRNKFKAIRTNGMASKLEAAVYNKLLERELLGEIKNIKKQCSVKLVDCDVCGTRLNWKVDFSFEENGETVYCEAKGVETSDYRAKLKRWRELKPAKLEIWKGSWRSPKIFEIIEKGK